MDYRVHEKVALSFLYLIAATWAELYDARQRAPSDVYNLCKEFAEKFVDLISQAPRVLSTQLPLCLHQKFFIFATLKVTLKILELIMFSRQNFVGGCGAEVQLAAWSDIVQDLGLYSGYVVCN
jgi:hypothetical protein